MTDILLVIFTAVLAFVGWQQLLSSRTQVHLGLFEKRFGSYQACMKFLNVALTNTIPQENIDEFKISTQHIPFLFDEDVNSYRQELLNKVLKLKLLTGRQLVGGAQDDDAEEVLSINEWITKQLTEGGCHEKFDKYLTFIHWNPTPESDVIAKLKKLLSNKYNF
ncbi:hypothetical protein [Vibrio sp. TBV020]|uniref:hypothetical protein n=1 Tax=Vibrio sp. TBV020 TaxID=3137398 RepID=UPI0038CDC841